MLTVEKIGGTSMSKFEDVLNNIIIGNRKKDELYGRIFVVSAYSGVTNWLLEHKKEGTPGIYGRFAANENFSDMITDLIGKLKKINKNFEHLGLDVTVADHFIEQRVLGIEKYLLSMSHLLSSGYVERESILLSAREILASIGESHSAWNTTDILKANGINAEFLDLSGFDDSDYITIDERIKRSFQGFDFNKVMPIVTGYTKGTEGIMREFDRGYTEITFSKIAVEVKANEAIIHKEFHLSSADPKIVGIENSRPVGNTNFDVADQLADVGMEAIHPRASKPLEKAGINIRVKNTFEPDHPGTLITKDYTGPKSRVEIIAGSDKIEVIEIHDSLIPGDKKSDIEIIQAFLQHKVDYIFKSNNANSVSLVVWEDPVNDALVKQLRKNYDLVIKRKAAIVCAIGSNFAQPGVLGMAATTLARNKINILCVSQTMRQVNMQFIIERKGYITAIRALHETLCVES